MFQKAVINGILRGRILPLQLFVFYILDLIWVLQIFFKYVKKMYLATKKALF